MSAYLAELQLRIPEETSLTKLESFISQAENEVREARGYLEGNTDRIVTDSEMINGIYVIEAQPISATQISVTHETIVADTDTLGTITIIGVNAAGNSISEDIMPVADSTVYGLKKFRSVYLITGAGWVASGGTDVITIGTKGEATETRWFYAIIELAEWHYNHLGIEGENRHVEGNIDRTFQKKSEILSGISSIARAI